MQNINMDEISKEFPEITNIDITNEYNRQPMLLLDQEHAILSSPF